MSLPVQTRWLLWIVVGAACVEPSEDPVLCVDLFPSECVQESTCRVLSAYGISTQSGEACVDYTGEPVGVGCDDEGRACVEEPTLAAPPDDPTDCFSFNDSCIPADWVECEDLSELPPEC